MIPRKINLNSIHILYDKCICLHNTCFVTVLLICALHALCSTCLGLIANELLALHEFDRLEIEEIRIRREVMSNSSIKSQFNLQTKNCVSVFLTFFIFVFLSFFLSFICLCFFLAFLFVVLSTIFYLSMYLSSSIYLYFCLSFFLFFSFYILFSIYLTIHPSCYLSGLV